ESRSASFRRTPADVVGKSGRHLRRCRCFNISSADCNFREAGTCAGLGYSPALISIGGGEKKKEEGRNMKKARVVAHASLLIGILSLAGCISAGIDVGGHGVGAGVAPLGAGVDVY